MKKYGQTVQWKTLFGSLAIIFCIFKHYIMPHVTCYEVRYLTIA